MGPTLEPHAGWPAIHLRCFVGPDNDERVGKSGHFRDLLKRSLLFALLTLPSIFSLWVLIALSRQYRFMRIACHPFDRPPALGGAGRDQHVLWLLVSIRASAASTARLHLIDQRILRLTSPKLPLSATTIARVWTQTPFAAMIISDGLGRCQRRDARNWCHRLLQPLKLFRHVICSRIKPVLVMLLVYNAPTAFERVIAGEAMIAAVSA
jgi:ABC-type sugar transport system permease subunit